MPRPLRLLLSTCWCKQTLYFTLLYFTFAGPSFSPFLTLSFTQSLIDSQRCCCCCCRCRNDWQLLIFTYQWRCPHTVLEKYQKNKWQSTQQLTQAKLKARARELISAKCKFKFTIISMPSLPKLSLSLVNSVNQKKRRGQSG